MLFAPEERGQGLIEYAIVLVLVAVLAVVVVSLFGSNTGDTFSAVNNTLP